LKRKLGWQPYEFKQRDFRYFTKIDLDEAQQLADTGQGDASVRTRADGERIGGLRLRNFIDSFGELTNCPIIICDYCGEPIEDARNGNYQWVLSADYTALGSEIYFTHKKCCHPFEEYSKAVSSDKHLMWSSWELRDLPIYLGTNLGIDWSERLPEPLLSGYKCKSRADLINSLYQRHGGICGICGEEIDFDLDAIEIDHIMPRAKGGKDSWNNLQLSHKECNRYKSDKVMLR
jgi:hypothetical protein